MFRLFVLAVLLTLAVIEYKKPIKPFLFPTVFALLTLMLALRAGQGTDYFSYSQIYTAPETTGQSYEIGFVLLNRLAGDAGIPYTVFIFMYSLLVMGLLYLLLSKAVANKFMGLFVVYSLYWLQFFESCLRQMLALLLVLLGFWLAISKKKIWIFPIAVVLGCTLHISAAGSLLLLLPLLAEKWDRGRAFAMRHRWILLGAAAVLCVGLFLLFSSSWPERLAALLSGPLSKKITIYLLQNNYSILSLFSRIVFLTGITLLYAGSRKRLSRVGRLCFQAYVTGFFLYCALFRFDLIASRVHVYYKILEVLLFPELLSCFSAADLPLPAFLRKVSLSGARQQKRVRAAALTAVMLLLTCMYLKTTKDVMEQSLYKDPGYLYPYYCIRNVDDMYTQRQAPSYAHKEYYRFLGKADPRPIGTTGEFVRTCFSALPVPRDRQDTAIPAAALVTSEWNPLGEGRTLPTLLREDSADILREFSKVGPSPSPSPEKTLPMRLRDLESTPAPAEKN